METTLDPQAVALAKAIRQSESGGDFNAQGKSGEFGAYQYTPATWAKDSSQAGVNVPLNQATPEQQNEVAYKTIKALKDKGYNVGQIASVWNAGSSEPDAYLGTFSNGQPSVGKNSQGVQFDVPAYAKSVATAYQTIKGGGQVQADPNNPSSIANDSPVSPQGKSVGGFLGNVVSSGENFLGGVGQALMHPVKTIENLGSLGAGVAEQGLSKLGLGGASQNIQTPEKQQASNVEQFYKQRYGGLSNIGNTLYNDPVGAAADASVLLGGAGALASKVGKVADLGTLSDVGSTLSKASDLTNPLAIPGKILGKTSDMLKNSSNKSFTDALAATTKQNKFLTEPIVQGRDTTLPSGEQFHVPGLIERGKVGSLEKLSDTAYQGLQDTGKAYDIANEAIPATTKVQVQPIIDQIEKEKSNFTITGENGLNIVDKGAYQNLIDLQNTIQDLSKKGLISKQSLTELKQLWQTKVAKSGAYYGKTLAEGSSMDMLSVAEKAIRRQLDTQFPDVAKINAEYKFWKDTQKVINDSILRKKGQSGALRKGLSTITGAALGAGGGFFGSAVGAVSLELLQEAMHSPLWKTTSAVVKDRIANALVNQRVGELNLLVKSIGTPLGREEEIRGIKNSKVQNSNQ